jgi:molybdate transport system substrate-binding protein
MPHHFPSRELKNIFLLLVALVALLSGAGCKQKQPSATTTTPAKQCTVTVAAAADLKFAFDDMVAAFAKVHPAIRVTVTYGSSGTFFNQLMNQAPFDLFLSADLDYPHKLIAQGLAAKDSEFQYAVGRIVVWVPNKSPLDLDKSKIQALLDPSVKRIAIANPEHAPYGRAAEAAMKKLGVYDQAKDRLVLAENIAQTAQFVQTGAADIGVLALALAVAPTMKDQGRYWEVPLEAYPRMDQGGVILSWAQDPEAAKLLRDFVCGAEGKAILTRYGFSMAKE